ncbi:hypothetical protein [Micromonospora sp. NBC_01813]|uniref:hypothetical protein n=1 Tax=Micromonospora sp. NBC_01813 TaxID=2975988 RepID=UPI002DDAE9C1|nr:hypothetical protein [Micromonospora sp. NBC_01813]WSA08851.1 hypothetical protein OG958_32620 [Micromonospora sp. NBC_01813]
MDFWDLTKLLFRRWYFAVPLLVISVAAAGWTRTSVEPDYISTSYVQLIPPTAATTAPDEDTPSTPRNPWLELGLGSLSRAAALTVQDQAVLKQLDAAGFSENVAITLDNQQPIMTIEVIGTSEVQATETTEEVVRRLEASVVGLQSDYGASEESFITTRRLDRGDNIQEANSKVNRAMIAVAGVGVLLSAAITIAVDGLLRRRRPRPAAAGPANVGSDETMKLPSGAAKQPNGPSAGRQTVNGGSARVGPAPGEQTAAGHSGNQQPNHGNQQPSRPRPGERDGATHSAGGGVYSSGSVSQMRQDELRRLGDQQSGNAQSGNAQSGNAQSGNAQSGNARMGSAPMAGTGPLGGQVPITGLTNSSATQRPSDERTTGKGPAPADRGPAQPPSGANDETAVMSVVRDDATIILPKPAVGREPWTQSEASENGSRTR